MSEYRRYRRPPRQTTKALTVKLAILAIVATLGIGGLIAAQMAAGKDPALGPKAATRAKKASTGNAASSSSNGSSTSGSSGSDPYTQSYDGYSSGYSSGSSGYSYSSPAPVTSSTS